MSTDAPFSARVSTGSFWLIVPGIACIIMAWTEGSLLWGVFITISAYLGLAAGLNSGDAVLASVQQAARSETALSTSAQMRGVFSLHTILWFWVPQILFLYVCQQVAMALNETSAPRSLKETKAMVMMESLATYFATVGGAWYKAWQWKRNLPK